MCLCVYKYLSLSVYISQNSLRHAKVSIHVFLHRKILKKYFPSKKCFYIEKMGPMLLTMGCRGFLMDQKCGTKIYDACFGLFFLLFYINFKLI
jgi:hypothetical protein